MPSEIKTGDPADLASREINLNHYNNDCTTTNMTTTTFKIKCTDWIYIETYFGTYIQ